MTASYRFLKDIDLHVKNRISKEDAHRQTLTAREILRRFRSRPGVILADEVGMGKTFVALAVAVSVVLSDTEERPVVIMIPPSLKKKWPRDLGTFLEACLPQDLREQFRYGTAERAVEFLKFLDDPPERRKSLVFVTHGAMSRSLFDKWTMLALIRQSLLWRRDIEPLRHALHRFIGELLEMKWAEKEGKGVWEDLLDAHPSSWLRILQRWGIDPDNGNNPDGGDDPVPEAVWKKLPEIDRKSLNRVFEALQQIPRRRTKHFYRYLREARQETNKILRELWNDIILSLDLRLPLLVLDEAHHLKNARTKLAGLFHLSEARDDADSIASGALAGTFERMLFLTATPFQLGHGELCSILERFKGIAWDGSAAPKCGIKGYQQQITTLRGALDKAQSAAVILDNHWGRLGEEDLIVGDKVFSDVKIWWGSINGEKSLSPQGSQVLRAYQRTNENMRMAEKLLKPWVLRHLRDRELAGEYKGVRRRKNYSGKAIISDISDDNDHGIQLSGESLLPFLLAARASFHSPESRPLFAEGLASSYEAFLHTRLMTLERQGHNVLDTDDEAGMVLEITDPIRWYLEKLDELIPKGKAKASVSHPKLKATVDRVIEIWKTGEKVLVFCHYIATGKALRQQISYAMEKEIKKLGAEKLGCTEQEVYNRLDLLGKRFFDVDSPVRRACDREVGNLLDKYIELQPHRIVLLDTIRRMVRTPSFLVRFFPLGGRLNEDSMHKAMTLPDDSGFSLVDLLRHYFDFLSYRCLEEDRNAYIEAVSRIQTGAIRGADVSKTYEQDELQGDLHETLMANVRLANGSTTSDTRQRLMLTFNTPFFPEVLVSSSVMAEGVDLHLNCRYVIHHDLCWNPSTLEQRTGRVDRIGAKVEMCGQPIQIYFPFLGETQDEKMYRVVMDRDRWFSVVMGEKYKIDVKTTEKLANRIPFPDLAAQALAFRLEC